MIAVFDWHRFIAIQLWIFVLFVIYETATELNHLFGGYAQKLVTG